MILIIDSMLSVALQALQAPTIHIDLLVMIIIDTWKSLVRHRALTARGRGSQRVNILRMFIMRSATDPEGDKRSCPLNSLPSEQKL